MKNAFDGQLKKKNNCLNQRIQQQNTQKTKAKGTKTLKKKIPEYPRTIEQLKKGIITCNRNIRRREKETKERFEIITTENFPQIHVRH